MPFIGAWKPLINFKKKDRGGIKGFILHIAVIEEARPCDFKQFQSR